MPEYFCEDKGGGQIFLHAGMCAKGGPEKIDDRWSQIDAPLPVKNDTFQIYYTEHVIASLYTVQVVPAGGAGKLHDHTDHMISLTLIYHS